MGPPGPSTYQTEEHDKCINSSEVLLAKCLSTLPVPRPLLAWLHYFAAWGWGRGRLHSPFDGPGLIFISTSGKNHLAHMKLC